MKLRQVDKDTASSSASLVVEGIDNDSVYMVVVRNLHVSNDNTNIWVRVNNSGTAQTNTYYQEAGEFLDSTTAHGDKHNLNATKFVAHIAIGNVSPESANAIYMLYNFNDASSNSTITMRTVDSTTDNRVKGYIASGYRNINEANDGITILPASGNFASGEVTLYEVLQ